MFHHKHHGRRRGPTQSSTIIVFISILTATTCWIQQAQAQQPPQSFLLPNHNLENFHLPENTSVNTIVHQLKALDKSAQERRFSYHMSGDTFSVDEQSGEVRLIKPLDRERQREISVVVSVLDNSDQTIESRRRVIVVDDIDDSWPVFGAHKHSVPTTNSAAYLYRVEVSELAPPSSIVIAEIPVSDADEGQNAEIVFECRPKQSTQQACEVFSLEPRRLATGKYQLTVRNRQQLDYERVQSYKLSIVARGRRPSPVRGVPLETEALVDVEVVNVQDEMPVFLNAPYSATVTEASPIGTKLLNIIVQDGDLAPQRDLGLIIMPGPFSDLFRVVKDEDVNKIWSLEVNNTIDREMPLIAEAGNMFTISILAAELNADQKAIASEEELDAAVKLHNYAKGTLRKESVTIMVLDLPDSAPMFVQASSGRRLREPSIVFNVSESLQTGASLPNLDLAVLDIDQGMNSRFNLSLVDSSQEPQASRAFALETNVIYGKSDVVLNVLDAALIDYEQPKFRVYKFNLVASKWLSTSEKPLVQILEVQVNILDANDNAPAFERDQYLVEVGEDARPGDVVATIRATDKDSGPFGEIKYQLLGVGREKFKVISSSEGGKIVVDECGGGSSARQCLDYEEQSSYSLTYEARDRGGKSRNVSLIIQILDINDHAPKFSEPIYKRELISDNLGSKQNYISPQLIVRAHDGDGPSQGRNNITYRIKSSNLTSLDVDSVTGLVYLAQPLDLDNMISSLKGASSPSTASGAADKKIVFEAEVVAEDNGTPAMQRASAKIVLVVKGNPDGAPQFKQDQYQAFVDENQPPNKPFYQVRAIDPDDKDSQLRYSLGYDLNDLINVNPLTGELSFKTKADYDDFKGVPYNITVYAADNSKPYPLKASTTVSIHIQDVNDKRPRFRENEYKATLVQGKTRLGDHLLQVSAQDLDKNAQLNYSLVPEQLTVSDRNGQQFSLDDLANSTGGYLAQMNRFDRNQLVANFKRLFHINKTTGAIQLGAEPDYSFAAAVSVQVRVVDLNQEVQFGSSEVQQDFVTCTFFFQSHVDKSPIFAPPWSIERRDYNISMLEELSIGTAIFSLLAKDPTTNNKIVNFEEIYESDPKDYFRVDRSGVVYVNRRIDYEELAPSKRLSVSVKAVTERNSQDSETYSSLANLIIRVIDLNDNAPQFKSQNYSVSISESLVSPQEIVKVEAEDKDSSEFGQVFYSLSGYSSELFSIDPRQGVISLKKGQRLDRDTDASHSLLVSASDCNETGVRILTSDSIHDNNQQQQTGCKRSSVFVNIVLLDENDNDPIFANTNKRGEIEALTSETASVGTVLTQVVAVDVDEGANGQVSYEIVRNGGQDQASRLVKIDRDGYVSVAESLAGMGRPQPYRITIRAYDHGKTNSRQSHASLLLTISDVVKNDGVPKFIKPKVDEVVSLSETSGPGTFVYQVQAQDPDDEAGKLMYKFIQPSDTFDIEPFSGIIKTQNRPNFFLDRELQSQYTLIIVSYDLGQPMKQAHQVMTIKIGDVNDNEPYFERAFDDPPLVLLVPEEVPKDYLVGTIRAIDKDEGSNAMIGYEILEGNHNNLFRLESNSSGDSGNNPCLIYSMGRLDRETRESYTLTIKATTMSKLRSPYLSQLKDPLGDRNPFNQYNASDLSKIRVTIKLLDINDNRPIWSEQNAKSIVDSSAEVYSQLMVFKATDADSSNSDIQYSILDVLYYSDSRFRLNDDPTTDYLGGSGTASNRQQALEPVRAAHVFDIEPSTGILRNSVLLRPYIDGYFEVFVKADSGSFNQLPHHHQQQQSDEHQMNQGKKDNNSYCELEFSNRNFSGTFSALDSCSVSVTKAIVFVTHQRETFRFVFNKTKLNDRLDEFKTKIQNALETMMFERPQAQASTGGMAESRAEKFYLNTFNTDFYEREDGKLDFSTLTSCSQLVKFDDRLQMTSATGASSMVPNQVIDYEDVVSWLKKLNSTQQLKGDQNQNQNKQQASSSSIFSQYGLIGIERCLNDRSMYRMSLSERAAIYFAISIAVVGLLLAFIVSRMRKSYEKNLKLLQRSKYQYMNQYASLPPGLQPNGRPAPHHMSMGALPANNFIAPSYGSHLDYDGPPYDTWQL